MSFVKCTSCGHRNSQAAEICANCDAPLHSWVEGSASMPAVNTNSEPGQQEDVQLPASVYQTTPGRQSVRTAIEPGVAEKPGGNKRAGKPAVSRVTARVTEKPVVSRGAEKPVVTGVAQTPMVSKVTEEEFPYQTRLTNSALDLYAASGFASNSATDAPRQDIAEAEAWQMRGFPLFRPVLSGTIIHIESHEQSSNHGLDLLSAVLTLFAEIIWIVPNARSSVSQNETDRVTITRIRLRTTRREIRDAQMRGDPKGANLALGDVVSLWGRKHKGVLAISRGYDHTSKSSIGTNAKKDMLLPALIVIALILLAFYFSPSFAHFPIHINLNNVDIPLLLKNLGKLFQPR